MTSLRNRGQHYKLKLTFLAFAMMIIGAAFPEWERVESGKQEFKLY